MTTPENPQSNLTDRRQSAANATAATMREIENYTDTANPFDISGRLIFYLREEEVHSRSRENEDLALGKTRPTKRSTEVAEKRERDIQNFTEMIEKAKMGNYSLIGEYLSSKASGLVEDIKESERLTPQQRLGQGFNTISQRITEASGVGDPFKEPRPAWQDSRFNPKAPPPPQNT